MDTRDGIVFIGKDSFWFNKLMQDKFIKVMVLILVLAGCHGQIVSRKDGGIILEASVVPTSFLEPVNKMQVRTDQFIIIIEGYVIVPLGKRAIIVKYSSGVRYLCWDGEEYMYKIISH